MIGDEEDAPVEQHKAKISTKGRVILPKSIGERWRRTAGTELIVGEIAEGVLLRPAILVPRTEPDKVFGMLAFSGTPKTVEEMNVGIVVEAKRRHSQRKGRGK